MKIFVYLLVIMALVAGCAPPNPAVSPNAPSDNSGAPDLLNEAEQPKEDLPEEALPEEDLLEETLPEEELPKEAVPEEELPKETLPEEETPAVDLPETIKATITMESGGIIELELYPKIAPQSVFNFVYLARQGFYDGLKFHRIMKGFMIQGGDPEGTGGGGPGYSIKGEFAINGVNNPLLHERGVISMARQGDPAYDSAGSQFFIMHADYPGLNGSYAAFGKVVSGMDVVDLVADTPNSGPNGAVAEEDKPIIKSITIDDDIELPEPNRLGGRQ